MERHDNPAGRLHALLSQLRDIPPQTTLISAWAEVLKVSKGDVVFALGGVAHLLPDLQKAVGEVGDGVHRRQVARYREAWGNVIFPVAQPFHAPLRQVGLPSDEEMDVLDGISSHLHRVGAEGRIPSDEELSELRAAITSVLDDVREAELPEDVKLLVLGRLSDILRALDQISVKGPGGVRSAIEILVGSLMVEHGDDPAAVRRVVDRVGPVLGKAWKLFEKPGQAQGTIDAMSNIAGLLGTGTGLP